MRARGLGFALLAVALTTACGGATPPPVTNGASKTDGPPFKAGDVVAYSMKRKDGAVLGRTHSTYLDDKDGLIKIRTRVALEQKTREILTTMRSDLSPAAYKQLSSHQGRLDLRFSDRTVSIVTERGNRERAFLRDDAILLPAHDLMILALALKRLRSSPGTVASLKVIAPETLDVETLALRIYADPEQHVVVALPHGQATLDDRGRILRFLDDAAALVFEREDPPQDPPKIGAPAEPSRYVRPADARWDDREVRIEVKDGQLAGTLSEPRLRANLDRPSAPGIIFLSGTAAQDRHGFSEAIDFGTWQILDRLADEGFAVLRIDDRGTGASSAGPRRKPGGGPREPTTEIGLDRSLDDAKACLRFMRAQPAVDPEHILVIGHGKGGVVAAMLAAEEPELSGLALLSTPFHDVAKALGRINGEVAVFQGMKDFEVSWRDDAKPIIDLLKKHGHKRAKLFAYENVDHLMKSEPFVSSKERYADRSRRIDDRFLDDLAAWLKERAK